MSSRLFLSRLLPAAAVLVAALAALPAPRTEAQAFRSMPIQSCYGTTTERYDPATPREEFRIYDEARNNQGQQLAAAAGRLGRMRNSANGPRTIVCPLITTDGDLDISNVTHVTLRGFLTGNVANNVEMIICADENFADNSFCTPPQVRTQAQLNAGAPGPLLFDVDITAITPDPFPAEAAGDYAYAVIRTPGPDVVLAGLHIRNDP